MTDPNTAADPNRRRDRIHRRIIIGAVVLAALVVTGGGIGVAALVANQDSSAAQAPSDSGEVTPPTEGPEAETPPDVSDEVGEAVEAEERAQREAAVAQIEDDVTAMAHEDAVQGYIDAPPLEVSCEPEAGGALDLSEVTTNFVCFAATEDHGDGTASGYEYAATMDWTTGEYAFGAD